MLSLCVIPRNIVVHQFKRSARQLQTAAKLLSSHDSSSSSSSDSSDSDQENEKIDDQLNKKLSKDSSKKTYPSSTNERLNAILQRVTEASKKSKEDTKVNNVKELAQRMNVAIKPKRDRFIELNKEKPKKEVPYEQQLVDAAKDVAKSMKGDSQKTELELLSKVLNLEKPISIEKTPETEEKTEMTSLSNLLANMRVDNTSKTTKAPIDSMNERRKEMASKFKKRFSQEPSVAASLLHRKSRRAPKSGKKPEVELKVPHEPFGIFKNVVEQDQITPVQLSTWKAMEEREIKLATLSSPQNAFQELIQWTDQGKIWMFPINNEQGMEEEAKIHFSQHVFLERHLKDWCPQKGPIRHFMELVCTGLSKNPYMTVEEKIGHIAWYRDYFEDKKDLLNELELLDKKPEMPKRQIEG